MLKQDQEGFGSSSSNPIRALALLGAGVSGLMGLTSIATATDEALEGLAPPSYPWLHKGFNAATKFIRKSLLLAVQCLCFHFRDLVGVAYTEEEAKAMVAEIEVVDGPNEEDEMYARHGHSRDRFPEPYPNEQAARHSMMVKTMLLHFSLATVILPPESRFETACTTIRTSPVV
ncbi:hypothetical protein MRB53_015836 [Persea americana]|uniref:Uncharacterized protein n=1 Tax=Persea americana TaxID=3435 RepID=A0ACC2M0E2_PERAE|nr:hypothetical protein MRB53_015836 [Persea americana]